MKLTYLSHSCFLLQTASHRILIDPFLTGNPIAQLKAGDVECDFILLTHGHADHFGDTISIAKRTGATVVAPYELAVHCGKQGVESVHPMNPGGAWKFPFGRVKYTIAHHSAGLESDGGFLYLGNPCGILISAEGKTIYHAGDTALFLDMKLIGERDRIDVALLPIGDNFTMGIEDAALAADFLQAGLSVPIHFNTFDLIKADPAEFVRLAGTKGRKARVLDVGETLEI